MGGGQSSASSVKVSSKELRRAGGTEDISRQNVKSFR